MLRITGGELKGRQYNTDKDRRIRPTSSRVREAIFNTLQNILDIRNKTFLDLFAGAGGIGLEAISRGAQVSFVDKHYRSISLIKNNLEKLNLHGFSVIKSDAISFLKTSDFFDIIFMDPPYNYEKYDELIDFATKKSNLVLLEHKSVLSFPSAVKQKTWGDTSVSIFTKE